ncbi:Purine nucleoside phosphorylase, partial [Coemansia sp. RSA 678]
RGVRLREAVYCFTTGPSSETRAECQAMRLLGAEVIGTSTVPEVIVARHSGLDVLCLGLVTSVAAQGEELSAEKAALAALTGTPQPTIIEEDDILTRKSSVKKGGQRPNDLNILIQRIVDQL